MVMKSDVGNLLEAVETLRKQGEQLLAQLNALYAQAGSIGPRQVARERVDFIEQLRFRAIVGDGETRRQFITFGDMSGGNRLKAGPLYPDDDSAGCRHHSGFVREPAIIHRNWGFA
jgi:hypothetical protein